MERPQQQHKLPPLVLFSVDYIKLTHINLGKWSSFVFSLSHSIDFSKTSTSNAPENNSEWFNRHGIRWWALLRGKWEVGSVIVKAALAEINWNSPSLVTFLRLGVEGSLSHKLQSSDI